MRIPPQVIVVEWRGKESARRNRLLRWFDKSLKHPSVRLCVSFAYRVKSTEKEACSNRQAPRKVAHMHTGELLFLESPFWSFMSNIHYIVQRNRETWAPRDARKSPISSESRILAKSFNAAKKRKFELDTHTQLGVDTGERFILTKLSICLDGRHADNTPHLRLSRIDSRTYKIVFIEVNISKVKKIFVDNKSFLLHRQGNTSKWLFSYVYRLR